MLCSDLQQCLAELLLHYRELYPIMPPVPLVRMRSERDMRKVAFLHPSSELAVADSLRRRGVRGSWGLQCGALACKPCVMQMD